ncbi:MgtC/SapB family protein [Halanaerobium hydrogeniformans]|uniref:MgtC/SapB transporter n=1 Tax=Halanaerobium hydrogeniformans TaxID=656519 RepID=E4RLJ2_HALHG|nr:MgtC/SapB family protein [Halanaerobium hydrogeniformans]ADQ14906.1 MgtC/SapB transporter [Halanaerobium hydrogeniformans]
MEIWEFVIRLLVALMAGVIIGVEREWRKRMAGIRTNTLVALGAALYVLFSMMFPEESSPTRVGASIVSGIGFLGGGVIIKKGFSISGLNTAATLWCSAATGVLAGAGYLKEAIIGALVVLISHLGLRYFQEKFVGKHNNFRDSECKITIIFNDSDLREGTSCLEKIAKESGGNIKHISSNFIQDDVLKITAYLQIKGIDVKMLYDLIAKYSKHKKIDNIELEIDEFSTDFKANNAREESS